MITYAGVIGRILREIEDLDRPVGEGEATGTQVKRKGRKVIAR